MLTLNCGIEILFEKLTPETGEWIGKTLFALCLLGWGFYAKPVFWGQVNTLGAEGNYVCCLVIVVIFMGLGGAKR